MGQGPHGPRPWAPLLLPLDAWVLASNFRQYVGSFSGTVTDEAGGKIEVKGLRGLMEDHFARW